MRRASILVLLLLCFSSTVSSQGPAPVPTTRVLAIGELAHALTAEERAAIMPREVPDTLQLYLDGKIDQWWFRQDGKGVVFLLNVTSVEEARTLLEKLPLGQAKLMSFTYMPLGPLAPLRLLLKPAK